ncbi:MAG: PQQ-like beta-propeller repeat protein, partial [Verrucomicrobiales bacterium]|nr:PQQ-like beta-propeller repeat protein [Verrucomicrobiales bacterium]
MNPISFSSCGRGRGRGRSARLVFTVSVLTLAALRAPAGDWPHWRGPARNGISAETEWASQFSAEGPKVLWKAKVGMGFASVSVVNGRAYTTGNQADKDTVYCLDAATGKVIWQHSYAAPLDAKYYEGGTSSTPTVEGGLVYTLSKRGVVHCLEASTGAVRWTKDVAAEVGAKMPTWGYAGSVLIDGSRAVLNIGTHGVAVNKATGQVLWKTGNGESGYSTPLPYEYKGTKAYLIFAAKELVAVRADSGGRIWSHPWETSYDVNAADPVVVGPDRLFIASGYNRGGALLDVSGDKPKVVWENKNIRSHFNPAVLHDGHLYAIDGDVGKAQLRCVEVTTGKPLWTFKDTNHGAIALADGRLMVISEKGELMLGAAKPEAFKPETRVQVSGG